MWGRWTFINAVCVILFDIAVLVLLGPNALLYLFASFWFSVGGLHPLGARWVQEHFTNDPSQETFDYYGPLNILALNIGYHNEHHDFPDIPWRRLPELKRMAPEFYDHLKTHKSWFGLLFAVHLRPELYALHARRPQRRQYAGARGRKRAERAFGSGADPFGDMARYASSAALAERQIARQADRQGGSATCAPRYDWLA